MPFFAILCGCRTSGWFLCFMIFLFSACFNCTLHYAVDIAVKVMQCVKFLRNPSVVKQVCIGRCSQDFANQ